VTAKVRATPAGLEIDGGPLMRRGAFRDGVVIPHQGASPVVRLHRGIRPALELEVESVEAARALLRALRLDPGQAVATFRIGSRAAARAPATLLAIGLFVFTFAVAMIADEALFLSLAATVLLSAVAAVPALLTGIRSVLSIGTDGFLVRWLGTRRLVRFADVAAFSWREAAFLGALHLDVKLRSGRVETLTLHRRSPDFQGVVERLHQAFTATHGELTTEASVAVLARRDRPLPAWIASLRALGAGANATHRDAPVAPEALLRIVEDAGAEPESRAAAAIALTGEADEGRRARILSAARSVAAPKLRVALEAAARDADEAALAEALAAVEHEMPRRRRAGE
jgi:hypothetical protein